MQRVFKIIFFLMCFSTNLIARDEIDSCDYNAERIIKTYERLKGKYFEHAQEKLLLALNEDPILKNAFLTDDSTNYKKLTLHFNPILKLGKEAEDYSYGEDICKYFVFDTVNYDCTVGYYLADSLCFIITRGHNASDINLAPLSPGAGPPEWCSGDFSFGQRYYVESEIENCLGSGYNIIRDSAFVFYVDGFHNAFIIKDFKIGIYPRVYGDDKVMEVLDRPNEFIIIMYEEDWIRRMSIDCPVGGKKPWWKFWD